jgi:hypothetical protein
MADLRAERRNPDFSTEFHAAKVGEIRAKIFKF